MMFQIALSVASAALALSLAGPPVIKVLHVITTML
jgi:hypothetical protein